MLQTCPRGTLNEWVTTSDILDWQSFICSLLGLSLLFARFSPSSLFTLHKSAIYKVKLSCLTCCPLILLYFIYGCSTGILDNITRCVNVEFMSSSSSTVSSPTAKPGVPLPWVTNPRSWSTLSGVEPFPMPLCCPINPTVSPDSELLPKIWGTFIPLKGLNLPWRNDHHLWKETIYKQIVRPCKIKQEPNRNEWP